MVRNFPPAAAPAVCPSGDGSVWFLRQQPSFVSLVQTSCPNYHKQESVASNLLWAWLHPKTSPCTAPDPPHWGNLRALRMNDNSTDNCARRRMWHAAKLMTRMTDWRFLTTVTWWTNTCLMLAFANQSWRCFLPLWHVSLNKLKVPADKLKTAVSYECSLAHPFVCR